MFDLGSAKTKLNETKILNYDPSSLFPKTKFDFPLGFFSTSYPGGIDLMMKFTLKCKCLLYEQLGVVQDFQPGRPVKRLSKNILFVPLSEKPGQGSRCEEAKCQGTKGMGSRLFRGLLGQWTAGGVVCGPLPPAPTSLSDSCRGCPIPLVSSSSSSVNLTTLATSTHGKPLPTAKMMLS